MRIQALGEGQSVAHRDAALGELEDPGDIQESCGRRQRIERSADQRGVPQTLGDLQAAPRVLLRPLVLLWRGHPHAVR